MKLVGLAVNPQTGEIAIARGDDQDIPLTVVDSNGIAMNVTGASFRFTVKESIDDAIGAAKFQKTSGGGGIDTSGAASGIIVVSPVPADTQALAGVYQWDVEMVLAGKTRTLNGGIFRVRKDVTTPGTAGQPSAPTIVFPGGFFAVGSDGNCYLKDLTTGLWSSFRANGTIFEWSPTQSPTIPFAW